jgi:Zn ribbon nucleic-acid-binding protein
MEATTIELQPFDPAAVCPKCSGEDVSATWHQVSVRGLDWPCSPWSAFVPHPPHLCRKCTRCGYTWAQAPVDAERYDASTQPRDEETAVSIRKTGSAQDQAITDVEAETDDALARTASLARETAWSADDEGALQTENAQADEG